MIRAARAEGVCMTLNFPAVLLVTVLVVACAACSNAAPTASPLPTSTTIPTYAYVSPTPNTQIATAIAQRTQTAPASDTVAIGRDRYVALACGECHGENAEGSDSGPALAGTQLDEGDFVTYLRTGGTIGIDHQYASNRLSDRGARSMYHYLKSLAS